jgi:16S rRNA (cytosine1402-N4)-methyltransferase
MLLDLGVNMEHFKDGERGFSINTDAPLDMRFNKGNPLTAREIVNTYSSEKLAEILILYGDYSPKSAEYLAKAIVESRKKHPLETTQQLKEVLHTLHCNQKKIAVIFQVLRIETNKELQQLEIFLKTFGEPLKIGGRCAIMTYHSIEDRIVKNAFKALAEGGKFQLVNKKVIQPHYTEVQRNKAARSAKLRIIEKIL